MGEVELTALCFTLGYLVIVIFALALLKSISMEYEED